MGFMKKATWRKKIREACEAAGTYRPFFDMIIDALAGILERRDLAVQEFEESGCCVLITHVNQAGEANLTQNPALRLINDLNRDALQYWRDLGLTPAGLRRINEERLTAVEKKRTQNVLSIVQGRRRA